ncbi:MAG TPA: TetR/AcrR family transcriptional regulator [Anaerolineae bacterium]|nr:TetR/AcrR family transcriptional regulator [Anaerolineae bacterium]HOR01294.1 TetR/AcrR family transcriptional regulator [Anaerolineae bacterium]HPL27143.1 TetR/AcrR family transcriptional regulator [Anaerolineae bacterium]
MGQGVARQGGPEGRRQRRIARRQREILAAAARVFAEKSYASATTKDIAAEADVAEGTLYNYFGSKREILLAIAAEAEAPMEAALAQAMGMQTRTAMVHMFEKALDLSAAGLDFARTLIGEAWLDDDILHEFLLTRLTAIHQQITAFIRARIAAGAFRPIDPGVGARVAMSIFGGLILPVLRGLAPIPSPEERRVLAEGIVDVLLDGVRARP